MAAQNKKQIHPSCANGMQRAAKRQKSGLPRHPGFYQRDIVNQKNEKDGKTTQAFYRTDVMRPAPAR